MVQDLIRYDGLKEQVSISDKNISMLEKQVQFAEKQNEDLQAKIRGLVATNKEYETIDEVNQRTIELYKTKSAKLKRQRNVFIYFSAAALLYAVTR